MCRVMDLRLEQLDRRELSERVKHGRSLPRLGFVEANHHRPAWLNMFEAERQLRASQSSSFSPFSIVGAGLGAANGSFAHYQVERLSLCELSMDEVGGIRMIRWNARHTHVLREHRDVLIFDSYIRSSRKLHFDAPSWIPGGCMPGLEFPRQSEGPLQEIVREQSTDPAPSAGPMSTWVVGTLLLHNQARPQPPS